MKDAKILRQEKTPSILFLEKCYFPYNCIKEDLEPLLKNLKQKCQQLIAGLVVLQGGLASKLVDLARSCGIPVVSGAGRSGLYFDHYSDLKNPCIRRKNDASDEKNPLFTSLDTGTHWLKASKVEIAQYQEVSIDGESGRIFRGMLNSFALEPDENSLLCMKWVDHLRRMRF